MTLLNPGKLDETTLRARFTLNSEDDTNSLGRTFSKALKPDEKDCVGFIANVGTGKSTLVKGVHEGLGASYGYFEKMMVDVNGYNSNASLKGCLIRHFDLQAQPDDDDSHWKVLEGGLDKPGLELVEHARKWRDNRFGAIWVLEKDPKTQVRTASLYCSDEMAARPEIQDLITSSAP